MVWLKNTFKKLKDDLSTFFKWSTISIIFHAPWFLLEYITFENKDELYSVHPLFSFVNNFKFYEIRKKIWFFVRGGWGFPHPWHEITWSRDLNLILSLNLNPNPRHLSFLLNPRSRLLVLPPPQHHAGPKKYYFYFVVCDPNIFLVYRPVF